MTCLPHQCLVLEMSDDLIFDVYFPQFAPFLLNSKDTPAFAKLCAIGRWERDEDHALEASIFQKFGIKKQTDWPLAPISAKGEGIHCESGHWFLVHPVHLILQRDFFTLGEALQLNAETRDTLLADLNQHFSQDALRFISSNSNAFWYLQVNENVEVATYLLAEAMGRDVGKRMPFGKDGMKLQSLLNEVQMFLHDHPINQVLEQQGLPTVNSIWLSGGGNLESLAQSTQKPTFNFFANDSLSAGLAACAGINCDTLASDYPSLQAKKDEAHVLVIHPTEQIELAWFAPFLKALKCRDIKLLRCHFDVHGMTFTLTLRPKDTWKFWRKTRPVGHYFNWVN